MHMPHRPPTRRMSLPSSQKNCQECAPARRDRTFPLLSYEQTRPWAAAIKEAVLQKKMPPWFADPHYGKFSNDRSLSSRDIDILVSWVNNGAPKGGSASEAPNATFTEGWGIPKPDVVFQLPRPYQIPATGTIEYLHWVIPTGFKEDKWIQFAEARPEDRSRVHHIVAYTAGARFSVAEGCKARDALHSGETENG